MTIVIDNGTLLGAGVVMIFFAAILSWVVMVSNFLSQGDDKDTFIWGAISLYFLVSFVLVLEGTV